MDFLRIIEERRDGRVNSREALALLANGAADGSIPDYQLSAWLMAAYLNSLTVEETVFLTQAMADSGQRLDLTGLPKPWVDKHSTGGVGDKASIVLLPLLASCGLTIVKMSGAGLGITGGTVDKLQSIPGFNMALSPEQLKEQAKRIGIAITGQTPDLAPADKVLYALRDVTATVRSAPLIVSSILSKKIAGGAETIVLDVKCGSGAFMRTPEEAHELSTLLNEVGRRCGLNIKIAVTDMSQPLGAAIGNALEVAEAFHVLTKPAVEDSSPTARFRDLCLTLAGETLTAVGVASDEHDGRNMAELALKGGAASAKAAEWIAAQGGPSSLEKAKAMLPVAPIKLDVPAPKGGWIAEFGAGAVGAAVVDLGGGRKKKIDQIDRSVGVVINTIIGDRVEMGAPLFQIHCKSQEDGEVAKSAILSGVSISDTLIAPRPLVLV